MKTVTTSATPAKGIMTHEARDWVRIQGNATEARLETAPPPSPDSREHAQRLDEWVSQPIDARIEISELGDVSIESDYLEPASGKAIASKFRLALRDSGLVRPEVGKRYLVSHSYVALDRHEAERLLKVQGNGKIQVDEVDLVHAQNGWAVWSDGRVTTGIGLPAWTRSIKGLSDAAAGMVSAIRGSDSGSPSVGWKAVLNVEQIIEETTELLGPGSGGHYAKPRAIRTVVALKGGEKVTWWIYTEGYSEGYAFEIYPSKSELLKSLEIPGIAVQYVEPEGQLWEPCPKCGHEPVLMPLHLCEKCWPAKPSNE